MEINYSALVHQTRNKSSLIEYNMLGISNKMPMGLKGHLNVHSIATKMKENVMYIQMEDGRNYPFVTPCSSCIYTQFVSVMANVEM